MRLRTLLMVAACCGHPLWALAQAAGPAPAQTPAPAAAAASVPKPVVRVSTDPARAAGVLKAAAELKKRPAQAAVGLVRAETAAGYKLLSGGVSAEDRQTMQAERPAYSLWVATVAKPSGAYLADVDLRIERLGAKAANAKTAATNTLVHERRMEGPWLLLALPPGNYQVTGTFRENEAAPLQTLSQRVSVLAKGQRQAVLRFASEAMVDSDARETTAANPFGTPGGAASAPGRR